MPMFKAGVHVNEEVLIDMLQIARLCQVSNTKEELSSLPKNDLVAVWQTAARLKLDITTQKAYQLRGVTVCKDGVQKDFWFFTLRLVAELCV